jgi:hypothetical protein
MNQLTSINQRAIRDVLLHDWDPIGIADTPEAQDEYDSYISQIFGLLIRHESKQKLFDFLWWVETENMGLCGNRKHTEAAVDKLIQVFGQLEQKKA